MVEILPLKYQLIYQDVTYSSSLAVMTSSNYVEEELYLQTLHLSLFKLNNLLGLSRGMY